MNLNETFEEKFIGTIVRTSDYDKHIRPLNRFFHIKGNILNIETNEIIDKDVSIIGFCRDCNQYSFKNAFKIDFDKNWYSFPLIGEQVKGLISRKFQNDNPHKIDARPQALLIEWCENQIPFNNTKLIKRTIGEKPQYQILYDDSYGVYFNNKQALTNFFEKLNIHNEKDLINYIKITKSLQNKIFNIPSIIDKVIDNISTNKDTIKLSTYHKSQEILNPTHTYLKGI